MFTLQVACCTTTSRIKTKFFTCITGIRVLSLAQLWVQVHWFSGLTLGSTFWILRTTLSREFYPKPRVPAGMTLRQWMKKTL